ncbi:MAG: glycosyltransferase, partial [Actinomycetota bacterium]|nr:glycosyltransferase [Actinomycetota bacterium]
SDLRIAFASREVYPLGGGGIAQFVSAAARLLSSVAEVTILTTSLFEEAYERLCAQRDPRLPGKGVRIAFVPEPTAEEAGAWTHVMHCYGARVYERLRELYPDGGPDLIEFPDFLGEAFVTVQAAEALDPFLAQTRVCVRIHTTAEICEVLDGFYKRDARSQALHAMERYCLAKADRLIWQGGDVLGTYRRFYGAGALAPATRVRYPYLGPATAPGADSDAACQAPLRLLYAGRLERRKGVQNLIAAATGCHRDDFRLTLVGPDTNTAPLGHSMRALLELAIAGDGRIELRGPSDRGMLAEAIRAHDVVVISSLWECWPYAALEPLHLNRPILATPVGGLAELVAPGASGWLARGTGASALADALEALLDRKQEVQDMVRAGTPLAHGRALSDDHEIVGAYRELAGANPRRGNPRSAGAGAPLVSAIVPYYRASRFLAQTIDSLRAQTYPRIEIVLVNDGSFEDEDWIVAELASRLPVTVVTQMNQGLGAARNFGIAQSRGRYIFPLDADNIAEPELVARCVTILEHRHELAYVTSWSRYIDDSGCPRGGVDIGYEPLGNHAALNSEQNVAGDAAAVLRRRIFDAGFRYSEELTSFEDWHLYRELQRAGQVGAVIPERLLRYRVREDSLQAQFAQPKRARLIGEIEALMQENGVRWTSSSA